RFARNDNVTEELRRDSRPRLSGRAKPGSYPATLQASLPRQFVFQCSAMSPETGHRRLAYIDWMRGLACLLMFQTHCYHAWLGGEARHSRFFALSQALGTFPAPLFLFLAGMSSALMTQRLLLKGAPAAAIGKAVILRGAEVLGFGMLFRLQEFAIALGWAPWT